MSFTSLSKFLALCAPLLFAASCRAQITAPKSLPARQSETLGRGLFAQVQDDGKVWVGWRMLPGEAQTAFDLYRASGADTKKLNDALLTGATDFVDETADLTRDNRYFVRAVTAHTQSSAGKSFVLKANAPARPYLSIPLQTPAGYAPNDASVGDLDGDGELDLVLHQAERGRDNSQNGATDPPILQGIKLNGTLLWTINLGRNIREGAHYTQFMVFDLDGDGRAEIACKTADGTVDGVGKVIGDAKANYVNADGRILSGPEYFTIFDGKTGAALVTTKYLPARHPDTDNPTSDQLKAIWGDGYGNRNDRFLACIAYLDGVHPSVVMARGYYTRTVLAAWDFRGGRLKSRWGFDTNAPGLEKFAGQGNHNLSVGDVDSDGKDEIIYGHMVVDDDGTGLWSSGIGHGDAIHLTDIDPAHLGLECWAAGAGLWGQVFDARGDLIPTGGQAPPCNMGIYWDGDFLSELLDGTRVSKWNWNDSRDETLFDAKNFDAVSNNSTKANPVLVADLWGDWREEIIYRTADNRELRVFSSMIPTTHRMPTLMSDPIYRLDIAWQNVGYNQPPHLSYALDPRADYPNLTTQIAAIPNDKTAMKFSFGEAPAAPGFQPVSPTIPYDPTVGYGFESTNPALFSVAVPAGFYDVTVTMGDAKAATVSVKAEARRLMLHNVSTAPGQIVTRSFGVAVKRPTLKNGREVRLKDSQNPLDWDDKLTLEFAGDVAAVRSVEIAPAKQRVGVFIAGDSTVTDQNSEPWTGWGQILPRFFGPGAAAYNNAQSGETLASFAAAGLEQQIWEWAQPGDTLLIQFGHNDQKDKSPDALEKYRANLRRTIAAARAHQVAPILVTPMERRFFKGGKLTPTLAENAAAMREVGRAAGVPVIDLNAASITLFNVLGAEGAKTAFVHYPANTFPGQTNALKDDSHFNAYGAYELARIVADGLKAQAPQLAPLMTDDLPTFDPATPDDPAQLNLPVSAPAVVVAPEGS